MKMKKWMALSCAAAMVLSTFPVSADEAVNEDVSGSITVWEHAYSFEEALKAVIEGFKAKYPNVEVDYEIKASDYQQVLATALQSGEGPDLFWTNGTATDIMPGYVNNGMVEDLTDVVDFSIITDDAMKLATIDGKQYSVPWLTMDSRACFYNKDIFAENGWEVPKTFSEFEELLAKIKEAGITPISQCYEDWSLLFIWEPVMSAYDPEYTRGLDDYTSKADGPGASGSLQKLVDWANAGYFGDNWLGVINSDDALLGFTTGNAAMLIGGTWTISSIDQNNPDLNYGAFAIPAEDGTAGRNSSKRFLHQCEYSEQRGSRGICFLLCNQRRTDRMGSGCRRRICLSGNRILTSGSTGNLCKRRRKHFQKLAECTYNLCENRYS